jgi:hypothetical protein
VHEVPGMRERCALRSVRLHAVRHAAPVGGGTFRLRAALRLWITDEPADRVAESADRAAPDSGLGRGRGTALERATGTLCDYRFRWDAA